MECSKCYHKINPGQEVCLSCGHILRYESENSKKCIHCNRMIPVSYKKCPYCKKKQTSKKLFFMVLLFIVSVILLDIHLIDILNENNYSRFNESFLSGCEEVSYEELVRKNVYYDGSYIKITAKVLSVSSISNFSNKIKIIMYTDDDESHQIEIIYNNKEKNGLISGDTLIIYGKMKNLDGNKPIIKANVIEIK